MSNVPEKSRIKQYIVIYPQKMKWVQEGLGVPKHEEVFLFNVGGKSLMVYGKNRKSDKRMIDDMWDCDTCYKILSGNKPTAIDDMSNHLNDHEVNLHR